MSTLQNFLPEIDKENLESGYKRRRIVVMVWMSFFGFLISATMLLPVLFLSQSKMDSVGKAVDDSVGGEQTELLALPGRINKLSTLALSFKTMPRVSDKISDVQNAVISGIKLSGISYAPLSQGGELVITLSGTAKDRVTLLAFEKDLKEISFVKSTSIPVANFAKDSNLAFSIIINLKQ